MCFNPLPTERKAQGVKEMVEQVSKRKTLEGVMFTRMTLLSSPGLTAAMAVCWWRKKIS